jgi:hypothetical protein
MEEGKTGGVDVQQTQALRRDSKPQLLRHTIHANASVCVTPSNGTAFIKLDGRERSAIRAHLQFELDGFSLQMIRIEFKPIRIYNPIYV